MFTYFLITVFGIALLIWAFWYDKNRFKPTKKKNGKMTKPYHKRWWIWVLVVFCVIGGLGNMLGLGADDDDDNSNSTTQTEHIKKVNHSKNLPGQKINTSKATKHEFYCTSKDDKKVRYFVSDGKITAMKVVLTPDVNNTFWCKAYLANVLHDDNLKYTNDKLSDSDTSLSNDKSYNIYSPKYKKWYRVVFDPADNVGKKDNMVATFSVFPGKSKDAE